MSKDIGHLFARPTGPRGEPIEFRPRREVFPYRRGEPYRPPTRPGIELGGGGSPLPNPPPVDRRVPRPRTPKPPQKKGPALVRREVQRLRALIAERAVSVAGAALVFGWTRSTTSYRLNALVREGKAEVLGRYPDPACGGKRVQFFRGKGGLSDG